MDFFVNLLLFALNGHLFAVVESDSPFAINSSSSMLTLYEYLANADAPSHESDLACTDANIRKRICNEITSSGYFQSQGFQPVNMEPEILSTKLRDREIFSRIYATMAVPQRKDSSLVIKLSNLISSSSNKEKPIFEYQNSFAPREFSFKDIYGRRIERVEHVFVCLLENEKDGEVNPLFVSKEYNVDGDPFVRAGRFMFTDRRTEPYIHYYTQLLLAEEPAKVFEDKENPKYDVELKYLERRQGLPLAPNDASDPVCSLLSKFLEKNYGSRLCAMVMSSSDFQRAGFQYVEAWNLPKCEEIRLLFQSAEARKMAGQKEHRERALRCRYRDSVHGNSYNHVYVTRAYVPNQVFVLEYNSEVDGICLKNLITDVRIVRN